MKVPRCLCMIPLTVMCYMMALPVACAFSVFCIIVVATCELMEME